MPVSLNTIFVVVDFGVVPAAKLVLLRVNVQSSQISLRHGRHPQARSLQDNRDASSVIPIDL